MMLTTVSLRRATLQTKRCLSSQLYSGSTFFTVWVPMNNVYCRAAACGSAVRSRSQNNTALTASLQRSPALPSPFLATFS